MICVHLTSATALRMTKKIRRYLHWSNWTHEQVRRKREIKIAHLFVVKAMSFSQYISVNLIPNRSWLNKSNESNHGDIFCCTLFASLSPNRVYDHLSYIAINSMISSKLIAFAMEVHKINQFERGFDNSFFFFIINWSIQSKTISFFLF